MRKAKLVSVFVSLTLLLSIGTGAVLAQKPPPKDPAVPDLPGMDGPVSEWVDTDLTRLVDLASMSRSLFRRLRVSGNN